MPVVSCTNIHHRYGDEIILDGVSLSVEPGDRIGLVGRNGTGKSTLLKVIAGIITPIKGQVSIQRGSRVGYLTQDPELDPDDTLHDAAERAFAHVHALHEQMDAVYAQMESAAGGDLDRLMKRHADLEAQLIAAGGGAAEHRLGEVLHGLGFTDAQFRLKVGQLSGGQRGRLALAKLLLESPDVLLLDEPTNHLDIDGRIWLEEFLTKEYRGAVLMVSHDRYLLDNVVTRILETEQGRTIDYPGNYEKFVELRAQRREVMLRAYEAQQDKFRKEEAFIRRYKAGQRAKQARGRQSKLEREKLSSTLERPMELGTFGFRLPAPPRSGDVVVSLRGAGKAYRCEDGSKKVLFHDLDVSIQRGERWGIIGPNGAGKSTLVRCMLGETALDGGKVQLGSNLVIGYYKQTHEGIDLDQTVVRYLQGVILKENPGMAMSEQEARNLAGAFLFSGAEQEKLLFTMSGGERSRAVLAGLLASAKNLIVLDEPTNHLDIPSAERLEDALCMDGGFEGTLILISHDRALIDATCDHLIVLDGEGNAEVVLGNYTEWAAKHSRRRSEEQGVLAAEKARKEDAQRQQREAEERRRAEAARAKPKQPTLGALARMTTEQIEARIEQLQEHIRTLDEALADPAVWRDAVKSNQISDARAKLVAELEPLEFEWSRRAEA
ncbi:MAG TPA: ABC-F family ATP-binding cassette domain-containing protein [Phycisphaerales bacterium]|nr:ABC-F family ATP-binding cassette domain-containing protein [Phycisphaerales bacterium]